MTKVDWLRKTASEATDDCIPFEGCIKGGRYGWMSYGETRIAAHRAMFDIVHGFLPRVVMHTCDNPPCVNPNHLKAGTQADNVADRVSKGRCGDHTGTANGRAKLTEKEVIEIRKSEDSTKALSHKYGVNISSIRMIKRRETWAHV